MFGIVVKQRKLGNVLSGTWWSVLPKPQVMFKVRFVRSRVSNNLFALHLIEVCKTFKIFEMTFGVASGNIRVVLISMNMKDHRSLQKYVLNKSAI